MPIDASVYNLAGRGVKSIADYDAEAANAKQNQLLNLMGQAKMDEYQRGIAENNKLNQLYAGAVGADGTVDRTRLLTGAAAGGMGSRIPGMQDKFAAQDKAQGEVSKQKVDLIDSKLKQSRQYLAGVQTPEDYLRWHEANHADPVLGPELASRGVTAEKSRAMIVQALQQPGGLEKLIQQSALGMDKFTELNKPTLKQVDSGQTIEIQSFPGMGGAPSVVGSTQKLQSPESRASNAVQIRGQNLKYETDKQANKIAENAIVSKKVQDVESKLADDYRTESKGFAETSTAMKKGLAALTTADKNPGSALAAGTAFMKILDPNSVVRESELGMALNASGWFDRTTNIVNTLQSGKIMTKTQQKNLTEAANVLFEEAKAAQREIDASYEKRAKEYGGDPKRVIVDRGQNTKPSVAKTAPSVESLLDKYK